METPDYFKVTCMVCLFFVFITYTSCGLDRDFCKRKQPDIENKDQKGSPPMPNFADFSAGIEMSPTSGKIAVGTSVYSTTLQRLVYKFRDAVNESGVYLYPNQDLVMGYSHPAGSGSQCESEPLDKSRFAKMFNIQKDDEGNVQLPILKSMIPATTQDLPIYIGNRIIRDIRTDMWFVCGFEDWSQRTVAAQVHFSEFGFSQANTASTAPVAVILYMKDSKGVEESQRFDYFAFQDSVSDDDKNFQIPKEMWCQNRPTIDAPSIKTQAFQVMEEKTDVGDPELVTPAKPKLTHYEEAYQYPRIFTMSQEVSNDHFLKRHRQQFLYDYTSVRAYSLDLTAGSCVTYPIPELSSNEDKTGGSFQLRTPDEIFGFANMKFQYMGVHKDIDRDIECDVFSYLATKKTDQGTVYDFLVYYFATQDWKLTQFNFKDDYTLPVRMEQFSSQDGADLQITDFYQYTRSPDVEHIYPDVTACHKKKDIMYIDLVASFTLNPSNGDTTAYVMPFVKALYKVTGIQESRRFAKLRFEPTTKTGETLIRFNMLGILPPIKGAKPEHITNDQAYTNIVAAIEKKSFSMEVKDALGYRTVNIIGVKKHSTNPTSFEGLKKPSSSGYTGGAMGGLGIGLLLVFLCIGFVVFKAVTRVRNPQSDVGMESLGKVMG